MFAQPPQHQIKRRLMRLSPTGALISFSAARGVGGRGFDEWKSIFGGIIKPLVRRASDLDAREATMNSANTSRYITLTHLPAMPDTPRPNTNSTQLSSLCCYSTNPSSCPRKNDKYSVMIRDILSVLWSASVI